MGEFKQATYGGKTDCVECGSVIHAGMLRWANQNWARSICAECHDKAENT